MGKEKEILGLGLLACVLLLSVLTTRAGAEIGTNTLLFCPSLTSGNFQEQCISDAIGQEVGLRHHGHPRYGPQVPLRADYFHSATGSVLSTSPSTRRNNYQDHRANALLHLVAPGGLEFTLGDNFTKSTLERIQLMAPDAFHENFLNAAAAYSFADRWKIEAKYNRDDLALTSFAIIAEYTNNLVGTSLYYRFLPRMSGLVEYDYAVKSFVSDRLADHKDQVGLPGCCL